MLEAQVRASLPNGASSSATSTSSSLICSRSLRATVEAFSLLKFTVTGTPGVNPESQDEATVDFRIFGQAREADTLTPAKVRLSSALEPSSTGSHLLTNVALALAVRPPDHRPDHAGLPGLDVRRRHSHGCVRPLLAVLRPRGALTPPHLVLQPQAGARFLSSSTFTPHGPAELTPPLPLQFYEYFVTLMPQSRIEHRAHLLTIPFVRHQESYDPRDPQPLPTHGETTMGPLGWIVHARSGDKGSDSNVGFFVRREDEFPWLKDLCVFSSSRSRSSPSSTDAPEHAQAHDRQGQAAPRARVQARAPHRALRAAAPQGGPLPPQGPPRPRRREHVELRLPRQERRRVPQVQARRAADEVPRAGQDLSRVVAVPRRALYRLLIASAEPRERRARARAASRKERASCARASLSRSFAPRPARPNSSRHRCSSAKETLRCMCGDDSWTESGQIPL